MKKGWENLPLADFVTSRPGNNKIIKGKQSDQPGDGLFQGFSASGPDVWVTVADYNKPGVVISAVGARCGKTFPAVGDWTAIANTHVLLPGKDIDPRWLWYRTNDEAFWIKGGAAQPFVKVKDTLQQRIPIPPLAEQQRIVGVLDEAFAGLATAQAHADRNLENARALFESHLQSVFSRKGEGWVEKRLEELTERITKGSSPKWQGIAYVEKPGVLFVTSENVGVNEILLDDPKYVEEKFNQKDRKSILKRGDVLTNIVGASIGRTAVFDRDDVANINQAVCLIRCLADRLMNRFLAYFLNSPVLRDVLHAGEVNMARANLSLGFFSELPVACPSLSRQAEIVSHLDALSAETQRLAQLYEQKMAALAALKKSLLHQAFSGEL